MSSSALDETIASLYDKLENTILPLFYNDFERYARIMRCAIALNGSFFNTQRMIDQYIQNAYHLQEHGQESAPAFNLTSATL